MTFWTRPVSGLSRLGRHRRESVAHVRLSRGHFQKRPRGGNSLDDAIQTTKTGARSLSPGQGEPKGAVLLRADDAASSLATSIRSRRGQASNERGRCAELAARTALERDGWIIKACRLRTTVGEIDIVAEKAGLLAIVEVKSRPTLADAAVALSTRQQGRLIAATEILLAENPDWGSAGVRFDLLLVDAKGVVRRIVDAFRGGG